MKQMVAAQRSLLFYCFLMGASIPNSVLPTKYPASVVPYSRKVVLTRRGFMLTGKKSKESKSDHSKGKASAADGAGVERS